MINNYIKLFRCGVHFSIEYVSINGCQNIALCRQWTLGIGLTASRDANNKIVIANNIATIQLIEYQSK